jgi:hypothetical protein
VVGPKDPDGHAGRGLGRARVVDGVVLEVLRHTLAGVEALLDLRVGDVAGHDQGAGERQAGLDRVAGELGEDLGHRSGQVDPDDVVARTRGGRGGRGGPVDAPSCSTVGSGR